MAHDPHPNPHPGNPPTSGSTGDNDGDLPIESLDFDLLLNEIGFRFAEALRHRSNRKSR